MRTVHDNLRNLIFIFSNIQHKCLVAVESDLQLVTIKFCVIVSIILEISSDVDPSLCSVRGDQYASTPRVNDVSVTQVWNLNEGRLCIAVKRSY